MKKFATLLFVSGVAVITYGLARWFEFRHYLAPSLNPADFDRHRIDAFQAMLSIVAIGFLLVSLASYCFGHVKGKKM